MRAPIRIATRGSELALWQAGAVGAALGAVDSTFEVEIRVVRTVGDRIVDVPLAQIGERGLFTKEIDAALINHEADVAVHSLKDLPTQIPGGLVLAAVMEREDPRDVLLCRTDMPTTLHELPARARIGTSSLRRRAQILAARSDLQIVDLRGNLNTRLDRLDAGDYDAIVIAAAGMIRLGWRERISEFLGPPDWLPAVGQGALAVVCREEDVELGVAVRELHDVVTGACTAAERSFLRRLEGGCQIPIGALAELDGDYALRLDGLIAAEDGSQVIRGQNAGSAGDPARVGEELAGRLLDQGGESILGSLRGSAPPVPAP